MWETKVHSLESVSALVHYADGCSYGVRMVSIYGVDLVLISNSGFCVLS